MNTIQSSIPLSTKTLFTRLASLCLVAATASACDQALHVDEETGEETRAMRDVVLLVGEQPVVECEQVGDDCILEGDIALGPDQIAELDDVNAGTPVKESALLSSSGTWWKWPNGVVPYTIHSNLPSTIRSRVQSAISAWNNNTNVKFVPRTNQADYVTFRYSAEGYAWAHIGRRGGQQFVNLVYNPVGVVIHEMGHTLGFYHEHTRPDRDNYVTIHWDNIRSGFEGNFYKYSAGRSVGTYDTSSVMHYPSYEFSRNGYATITRKNGTAYPGNYSGLSASDIAATNETYPSAGSSTWTTLVVDSNNARNDATRGYISVSGNWNSSTNVWGYYGTGYWWAARASVSDAAVFKFYNPVAGQRTIDLWWSAGSDRAWDTPVIVTNGNDQELGRKYVDQRYDGGQWNTIGTYDFPQGWNHVYISRWTGSSGTVVIADAVRVR